MRNFPAVVLLGITTGLQAGLLGVGIVLIYRASRFINFAQALMGSVAASALATIVFKLHAPYGVALVGALVIGAAVAAGIERLLGWRLFARSRLTLLVATIGIAQLALLATLRGPFAIDATKLAQRGYPEPFDVHWRIGGLLLGPSHILTLIVGPLLAVGLLQLINHTRLGTAIRGAASNPDAARLAGISVRQVSLIVWVIAGVLSSLTAILYAPSQSALGFAASDGTGLLLRGLAAALIAGMLDFRIALLAGIGLGIVEQAALFYTNVTGLADISVVALLAAGLLLRARTLERDIRSDDGLVVELPEPRVPAHVTESVLVRHAGRIGWFVLFGLLALVPYLPGLHTQERAVFLTLIVSFAMVGLGLTVLTGWGGQVSLGQFAVLGTGAYVAAYVQRWDPGLPVMLLVAGVVTAAVSAAVGLLAVRFRGLFLGVVTLGFAFVARAWLFRQRWLVRSSNEIATLRTPHLFRLDINTARASYFTAVGVLALTVLALQSLRKTAVGRALVAVRDNDRLASAYGMTPTSVKLVGLGIAGFVSGMAGGLWAMGQHTWNASAFEPSMSFVLLSIVIVGGLGTLHGPILGAFAVFAWPYLVPGANSPAIRALTSGVLLLVALLFMPGGIASVIARLRALVVDIVARVTPVERPNPEDRFGPRLRDVPLEVEQVSIAFGGINALEDVSLRVGEGEIVGLIGGNGAGKSTLLNCVSGHLQAAHGRVFVGGRDVAGLAPEYRPFLGMSRTFQDGRLFPGLTVREMVLAAADRTNRSGAIGALLGAPWTRWAERDKRARADDILAAFGLADRADSQVRELSTGMRRICDLAGVVASQPSIVLLDEPTAGLAQREVEAFAPLLRKLRDDYGMSMLVVEHDMPMLMSLCDRVYCLEAGRVIAEGTPDEVSRDPAVIASYLGTDARAVKRSTTRKKVRVRS